MAEDATPAIAARKAWPRVLGYCISLLLLAWAVYLAMGQRASLEHAAQAAQSGRGWLFALLLALPLLNWVFTSAVFWVLMLPPRGDADARSFTPVRFVEMQMLIGSAWLLNYLPLRAGMVGRIAYHARVNHIPVAHSIRAVIGSLAANAAAVALLVLGAWIVLTTTKSSIWVAGALLAPSLFAALAAISLNALTPRLRVWVPAFLSVHSEYAWRIAAATSLRSLDMLIWLARYMVAFELAGRPLSLGEGVAFTAVSQLAMVVPWGGGGLGLREWGVGVLGPAMPAWARGGTEAMTQGQGLAGDLLNRAAELAVALPVGVVCTLWATRRMASAGRPEAVHPPK